MMPGGKWCHPHCVERPGRKWDGRGGLGVGIHWHRKGKGAWHEMREDGVVLARLIADGVVVGSGHGKARGELSLIGGDAA
jgi:hypothetical protein